MISTPDHDQQTVDDLLLPILEHLEKGDLDVPVLPHVASQILALTSDRDADSSKLTALLHQDQVLASQVFKIANSPAHYSRYPNCQSILPGFRDSGPVASDGGSYQWIVCRGRKANG